MKPFYLDPRGWGMDQAFLVIERPPNRAPLTDADLAQMKVTRERAAEIIARLNADRDRALRSTGMGSYRVMLRRDLTTHMDFSDLPVLSAGNSEELEQKLHVLRVIESYVLAFFDHSVRGMNVTIPGVASDAKLDSAIEGVERFGSAKRPE